MTMRELEIAILELRILQLRLRKEQDENIQKMLLETIEAAEKQLNPRKAREFWVRFPKMEGSDCIPEIWPDAWKHHEVMGFPNDEWVKVREIIKAGK